MSLHAEILDAYLALLRDSLVGSIHPDRYRPLLHTPWWFRPFQKFVNHLRLDLVRPVHYDPSQREEGLDWPVNAETMVGRKRLDNIRWCIECVLRDDVPGDLIEAGAWRGGVAIYMRAILKCYGDNRTVWVADSFEGLPPPDPSYQADKDDIHFTLKDLAASLELVQGNFRKYGLLDEHVRFLKGWFKDTLRQAPIERLAIARLDGDMYGSTIESLEALYPKLSPGGYLIVDDYNLPGARQAADDYRAAHDIRDEIQKIDWTGVYWRKMS